MRRVHKSLLDSNRQEAFVLTMRVAKIERRAEYKSIRTAVKAVSEAEGILEGYLNVKNVEDLGGDISRDGCFKKTLADSYARKNAQNLQGLWPFLYNHSYESPPVGLVTDAREDQKGLWIRVKCFMDTQRGSELYSAYAQGGLTSFSMGYKCHQCSWDRTPDGRSVRNLNEVQIMEASSVVFAMAPESTVTAIKAQGGSNMLLRNKDFNSNYQTQQLDDWQYDDWSGLSAAIQASIQDLFAPGADPLADFDRTVAPQLLTALRQYISDGIALGYSNAPSSAAGVTPMMSMSRGGAQEHKAGYLTAADHVAIKESSSMIMKHAKIIASASANVERANARARAGQLAGWPVYGSMSDRSIFETKEEDEAVGALLSTINLGLEVDQAMREGREMLTESLAMDSPSAGVNRALAALNASMKNKTRK